MSFYEELKQYPWADVQGEVRSRTQTDVEVALAARCLGPDGLISLLSAAAEPYLEEMAQKAHRITQQRFGKVISLFAPLYLSNQCINSCVYCGFNSRNPVERLTLEPDQSEAEGRYLHNLGFRHLLLVSGEAPRIVTMQYLLENVERLRPWFPSISIEIYPMETSQYGELCQNGVDGLVVFQETYNEKLYAEVHQGGKKRDFRWRLATPERGGEAGFRRIGLGTLLGLSDWRTEGVFMALHARYLLRNFWKSQVSISFPRLQPAAGGFNPPSPVSDLNMVQLITALRLFLPDVGFVLSTREPADLRDHLIPLGITSMSAGSRTDPGGYTHAHEAEAEAQFTIADERSPQVVADVIRRYGYEPVWKDWDGAFLR
jgi:2-iminoacetate synthase